MDNFIAQEVSPERRGQYIADSCEKVETLGYTKRFSQEELSEKEDSLSEVAMSIEELAEEKKDYLADINARIKSEKARMKVILTQIRNKSEYVKEECYQFRDEFSRSVGYYNSAGDLVEERPMRPEEMQNTIPFKKTGTHE